jgi:hypothetical protein
MKKIQIKSNHRPVLVWGGKYTRIVGGSITEVNGKPWKHAYVAVEGAITLNDIDWSPNTVIKDNSRKPMTKKVKGSKGNVYTITIYGNGKQTCTCPGYQYRRFCKHTGAK